MIPDKYERYRTDLNFIKKYSKAVNAATGSEVDANSNVSNKNIATMSPEIHKKANIYANRLAMHDKIKEMYGEDLADEYIRQLENHEIYRHDESGTPIGTPYCVSVTLYPFLLNGLSTLGGSSTAPKNLDSFCGGFCNLVFLVAAQFAGAVATPEWLAYMSYFLIKEYGEDYYKHADEVVELGNHPRTIKDVVHAKFQQVIYTLNQPAAARGSQSVFWNVAIFDEPYFKSLFETFYFPDGTAMVDIWDSVNWLQKTFMKWLNHERTKKVITFPVVSASLLNDGKKYIDGDMADWVAQMYSEGDSFFTYTSNSVDSLASCCYTDDTMVFVQLPPDDPEKEGFRVAVMSFADVEKDCKEHNCNVIGVWNRNRFEPGRIVHLPNRPVYKVTLETGEEIKMTDNHRNYIKGEEKPVLTKDLKIGQYMCLYNTHKLCYEPSWSAISSIEHIDYSGDTYCFEMCDPNDDMFTLANGVHNYNCRLKNEIHENTFSYTLGAGGVATGSKCVMTINLNRLVQNVARANPEYIGEELFPLISEAVATQTEKIHKYLTAFNEILKDMLANHMLPVYEAEYITLEKQYLTVGTNGLNEAAESLDIEISDNQYYRDFVEAIFRPISEIDKRDKTSEIMWNTEQVPAENLGVKFAKWDRQDGYAVPRDCYNSYFFLSEDTTLSPMDKLKLHGKDYTKYLDGGSACHINLSEHLSKAQYKFIMQKAIEYGTPYFTFNIPNTVCRDCGHISKHYLDKCPACGSDNVDYATRVIGYLTLISKWSVDRQKEGAKRYYAGADEVKVV